MTNRGAVLVTGGAGYIGAHACKALAANGYLPVVYDNLSTGHSNAIKWGPSCIASTLNRDDLIDAFEEFSPVAVMHFAAKSLVGESIKSPGDYYRANVLGTLTLLEAMKAMKVGTIVFSSTAAVYGNPNRALIREDDPKVPINPYGVTKWTSEQMIEDFSAAYGMKSVRLRYFNAAGADSEAEIGERHEPETHLIPSALEALTGDRPPLTLFGSDYPTPDGTCIRDYIHVTDLAAAHVRALDWVFDQEGSHVFNLGTGHGYSVREILDTILKVTGKGVPHILGPRRAGDPPSLVSDPSKAQRHLGWTPICSDLQTIVRSAWNWHNAVAKMAGHGSPS